MNLTLDKKLSLQIAGLQGFYWMIFCPISSYASVYLLSKNFSNGTIGWVMAISNIIAVFVQPALGALIDRNINMSLKSVLAIIALLCLAMLAGIIFIDLGLLWIAILYVGILAILFTMQPLVNALTFEYINAGHQVNFGVTRAMGSICFAILSPLLGVWVNRSSTEILPIVCSLLYIGFLLMVFSFPRINRQRSTQPILERSFDQISPLSKIGFFQRYSRFIPFLIGISCLFLFHTIINTYLAQIITSLGGQGTDIGVSLSIAAVCELPAFIGFNFLVSKYSNRTLLKFSGVFYALRSFVFLFAASIWMVNLGQVLQGISFAVFIPASVYYVNKLMRDEDKVKGQTFITGSMTLGSVFGSVLGGWLLDVSGVSAMLVFGTIGAVVGCFLMIYSTRKPKEYLHSVFGE